MRQDRKSIGVGSSAVRADDDFHPAATSSPLTSVTTPSDSPMLRLDRLYEIALPDPDEAVS